MSLIDDLKKLVCPGPERVGCIRKDHSILEFINDSLKPEESFTVPDEALGVLETEALATWHTHPQGSPNLSGDDYNTFRAWPELYHFIIGLNGVKCYKYCETRGAVIEESPDYCARVLEEASP